MAQGDTVSIAFEWRMLKVGQDISRLAGLNNDLGVVVEDADTANYATVDADVAIVATSDHLAHNIEGYERLLKAGLNVLSHGTESYFPSAADPILAAKIQTWAEEANVTLTASGIWDMSRIWSGILCAAPCIEIRSLHNASQTNLGMRAHNAQFGWYRLQPWRVSRYQGGAGWTDRRVV